MTTEELLDRLKGLLPPQFEEVVFKAGIPPEYLPGTDQVIRAITAVRYLERKRELGKLQRLLAGHEQPAAAPALGAEQEVVHPASPLDALRIDVPQDRATRVNPTLVYALLGYLVALDLLLATCALLYPNTWFEIMHGLPYEDPAGLLRRTGAVWVAFILLQAIALVRWRRAPYWLALIAGVRLTELFSDLTTVLVANQVTQFAWLTLPWAGVSNLAFAWFLISVYHRIQLHR